MEPLVRVTRPPCTSLATASSLGGFGYSQPLATWSSTPGTWSVAVCSTTPGYPPWPPCVGDACGNHTFGVTIPPSKFGLHRAVTARARDATLACIGNACWCHTFGVTIPPSKFGVQRVVDLVGWGGYRATRVLHRACKARTHTRMRSWTLHPSPLDTGEPWSVWWE